MLECERRPASLAIVTADKKGPLAAEKLSMLRAENLSRSSSLILLLARGSFVRNGGSSVPPPPAALPLSLSPASTNQRPGDTNAQLCFVRTRPPP
jgi:hypothetical protein